MICPHCQHENPKNSQSCEKCWLDFGAKPQTDSIAQKSKPLSKIDEAESNPISGPIKECPNCHAQNTMISTVCDKCWSKFETIEQTTPIPEILKPQLTPEINTPPAQALGAKSKKGRGCLFWLSMIVGLPFIVLVVIGIIVGPTPPIVQMEEAFKNQDWEKAGEQWLKMDAKYANDPKLLPLRLLLDKNLLELAAKKTDEPKDGLNILKLIPLTSPYAGQADSVRRLLESIDPKAKSNPSTQIDPEDLDAVRSLVFANIQKTLKDNPQYKNAIPSKIEVEKNGKNKYKGTLYTNENGKSFEYPITINYDGSNYNWLIQGGEDNPNNENSESRSEGSQHKSSGFFKNLLDALSDEDARIVKTSSLEMCPQKTLEQMANDFMASPSWESGVDEHGMHFVNIQGEITYMDKPVTALVQFSLNNSKTSFEFNAMEFNGVPQPQYLAIELLTKMCNE